MPVTYIHTYIRKSAHPPYQSSATGRLHTYARGRACVNSRTGTRRRARDTGTCVLNSCIRTRAHHAPRHLCALPHGHIRTYIHTYIRSRMYVDWGDIHTYVRPQTRVATATPLVVYIIHARSGACVNSRARTRRRACIRACMRARAACMRACVRSCTCRPKPNKAVQPVRLPVCVYVCMYVCMRGSAAMFAGYVRMASLSGPCAYALLRSSQKTGAFRDT